MAQQEAYKTLHDRLMQLDVRLGELEDRQKDIEKASCLMSDNIRDARDAIGDIRNVINSIPSAGSSQAEPAQSRPEVRPVRHYTSQDTIRQDMTPAQAGQGVPVHQEKPAAEHPVHKEPDPARELAVAGHPDITRLKCPLCGKVFAVDESNIKEGDIYYPKCPECKSPFQRRKPGTVKTVSSTVHKEPAREQAPQMPRPSAHQKPAFDISDIDWEKFIGKNAMGILASVLIFISLGIFGALVFPLLGNEIRFALMAIFSAAVAIAGGIRTGKDRNAFSLSLMACGIGAMYITFLCGRLLFGLYGDTMLFILFLLWAAGNHVLYRRYESTVFSAIGQMGSLVSVMLACRNILDLYRPQSGKILTEVTFNGAIKSLMIVAGFLIVTEAVYATRIRNIFDTCFKSAVVGISSIAMATVCGMIDVQGYLEEVKAAGALDSSYPGKTYPYYVFIGLIALVFVLNAMADVVWGRKNNLLAAQICVLADCAPIALIRIILSGAGSSIFVAVAELILLGTFIWLHDDIEEKDEKGFVTGSFVLNIIYMAAIMYFPVVLSWEGFPLSRYAGIYWFAVPALAITLKTGWLNGRETAVLGIAAAIYNVPPWSIIQYNMGTSAGPQDSSAIRIAWVTGILCLIFVVLLSVYAHGRMAGTENGFFRYGVLVDDGRKSPALMYIAHLNAFSAILLLLTALSKGFGSYPCSISLDERIYLVLFMAGAALIEGIYRHVFGDINDGYDSFTGICAIVLSCIGLLGIMLYSTRDTSLIWNNTYGEYTAFWAVPDALNSKPNVFILFTVLIIAVSSLFLTATIWLKTRMDRRAYGVFVGLAYSVLWICVSAKSDIPYLVSVGLIIWAVICIALGFRNRIRSMRLYGLILSILSVAKLVLLDIHYDNSMARAASMAVCGILLFIISFVYNRVEKGQADGRE